MPVPIDVDERFASEFGDWSQRRLTAREIAMLQLMNIVTDRPGWSVNPGWWSEVGWGRIDWRVRHMPKELAQSIQALVGDVHPNAAEVKRTQDELREERKRKQQQLLDEEVAAYMFGQHAAIGRKSLR